MDSTAFETALAAFGPDAADGPPPSARASRRYCRRLARGHYENFTVVSRIFPGHLRQHLCNIYAYCRWADDLADCSGDPGRSLELLDWWEGQLRECCEGESRHPVFVALAETIRRFEIPADPLLDLLVAFRQDQQKVRYETFDELTAYCRYSANPVGRLVLYLGRCHTPQRVRLSDSICTGLQLANFWQDVAEDWDRGRIYLPLTVRRRFGYDEPMFAAREANDVFRRMLSAEVDRAETWLREGLPLIDTVSADLRLPVALFVHGGLAVLEAIRRQDFDVWSRRPVVSRWEKLRLTWRCWWQIRRGKPFGRPA